MLHNPIFKWFLWVFQGCPMYTGAITAGVAAAATVASTVSGMVSGQDAAGAAGANAAGITNQQAQELRAARDNANKYQLPYYNTGTSAQNKLSYLMGLGNTVETPSDTTISAFYVEKKRQLQDHLATKPSAKDKAALKKWQAKKQTLNDQIKGIRTDGEGNQLYQQWAARQPKTKITETPIDSNFGSLLKDFTAEDFKADPGYQFRQDQGNRALQNKLSSIGMGSSGAAVKEAINFNQGTADQAYQGAWDRYMNNRQAKTNTLFTMAGTGQRAADNISNNNNQYGVNMSNALAEKGRAQQDAIYQGANSEIAGYTGISKAVGGLGSNLATAGGYRSGLNSGFNSKTGAGYSNTGVDSSAWMGN